MSVPATFTKAEFITELCRFRELFGQKTFWAKPEVERDAAIKGLMHVYFNLEPTVSIKNIAPSLEAALYEYGLRFRLMLEHGMEVGR